MPTVLRWSNENKPTDMIKKITGILFAAAVVAVIVAVVMHRGEYRSLVFDREDAAAENEIVMEADTLHSEETPSGQAAADAPAEPTPDNGGAAQSES